MDGDNSIVIETTGLSKTYGEQTVVNALELVVPRNTIFGFLGPNGAGKTTTMKMLLGLLRPTAGQARIFGIDIISGSLDIRRRVGYLPQQPRFYDTMSARQILRFTAGLFFSGTPAAIERRVGEMLELVGLADRADRPVGGFSGGELQRLGIAQAQIGDPDLLILDEPAAALDPLGRRDVLAIMGRLRERTTIFYSTHILNDVQQISDTVAILHGGRMVAQQPIDTLLAGDGGAVFEVSLRGAPAMAREELARLPWVSAVHEEAPPRSANGRARNGATGEGVVWRVTVSDPDAAEEQLLRTLLAHPGLVVAEFHRQRHSLEDVFVNLVEGNSQ